MATRGYQSYRGRNHGKLALVIVLVLILLAAVGYLVAQEYMVYDDEGHRHLELPFLKKGQTEQPQQPEDTTPDDVNLIIDEPERPLLKELHARQLPDTVLTEDPSAVLAEHPEAVVIPVKLRDGTVTYDTQTAARDTVTTGGPETLASLRYHSDAIRDHSAYTTSLTTTSSACAFSPFMCATQRSCARSLSGAGYLSNRVVIVRSSHSQAVFWTSCKCGQSVPFSSIWLYSTGR